RRAILPAARVVNNPINVLGREAYISVKFNRNIRRPPKWNVAVETDVAVFEQSIQGLHHGGLAGCIRSDEHVESLEVFKSHVLQNLEVLCPESLDDHWLPRR